MKRAFFVVTLVVSITAGATAQERVTRESKVRGDRENVEGDGYWIYNDLAKARAEAARTGKPILLVFRCIPCEACAQLDSEIVERDPLVRQLMEKFVCARVVHANGMDLSLFQFDYDQSFAAFFLNADNTIYGRYGTRSHQTESHHDVTLAGFQKSLERALEIHAAYPGNKESLAAKRGPKSDVAVPEQFPGLRGKYASELNYTGNNVVQSCIHCHQVGEQLRLVHRTREEPIPAQVLHPYPNPKAIGLVMDPDYPARVAEVRDDLPAGPAGFQPGDHIASLDGQPLVSIADIQWILHRAPDAATLEAIVERDGGQRTLALRLPAGWRRADDLSWRATSWDLRRMVTGGLVLEPLPDRDRRELDIAPGSLALRVTHVGQYNEHAVAKRAGFQMGDVVVELNGMRDAMRESDWLVRLVNQTKPGDKVPVTVLRGRRRVTLELPMQ